MHLLFVTMTHIPSARHVIVEQCDLFLRLHCTSSAGGNTGNLLLKMAVQGNKAEAHGLNAHLNQAINVNVSFKLQ